MFKYKRKSLNYLSIIKNKSSEENIVTNIIFVRPIMLFAPDLGDLRKIQTIKMEWNLVGIYKILLEMQTIKILRIAGCSVFTVLSGLWQIIIK